MNKLGRLYGFTLVELVVVIAVLGIISAIGIPSFHSMIKGNRIVTTINSLIGSLQYARAEAVRRGGGVRVSALSGDVNNGLRILVDNDGDNTFESGEELRVFHIENQGFYLDAEEGGSSIHNLDFTFDARGYARGLDDTVTIKLCDDRIGDHGRSLTLLTSGAIRRSTNTTCG